MRLDLLKGPDLQRLLGSARALHGDDVVILTTRRVRDAGALVYEIAVGDPAAVEHLRARLEPAPLPPAIAPAGQGPHRPRVIGLVGPTGAGKTTTLVKLALHPRAFGGRRPGLLTLDTYRVAALEQIETYARIAGLPLEVIYEEAEVPSALARLAACDVILVDTPGRAPRSARAPRPADIAAAPASPGRATSSEADEWPALLRRLRPDEVHLVLPAGIRADVAAAFVATFRGCGVTHQLLTKLDEVPGETGVAELAETVDLPARWITDGQEVPADLRPAAPRILASLGTVAGSVA